MMRKNNTSPCRFLPATETAWESIFDRYNQTITFSAFLKEAINNHNSTGTHVSYFDTIRCFNDTGILSCGQQFEQVKCIYLHTQLKETSVILAIQESTNNKLRFFKGLWDLAQSNINVWYELMPDIAQQEIAYLETMIW